MNSNFARPVAISPQCRYANKVTLQMVVLSSASQKLQRSTKGWTNISTAGTLPRSFIFPSDMTLICHENLHTPLRIASLVTNGDYHSWIRTFARTSLHSRCRCQHHLKRLESQASPQRLSHSRRLDLTFKVVNPGK
jgi:hypothetical protein